MSGYLARLALRAAGRPAGARLVPRIDVRSEFGPAADLVEASGAALASEVIVPQPGERDGRRTAGTERAPARAPRAPSAEAPPLLRGASAPAAGEPQRSARPPSARTTPAAVTPPDAPSRVDPIDQVGAAAPRGASRAAAAPVVRPETHALAATEGPANRTPRSRARPAERPHDHDAQSLDRPQPEAAKRSAVVLAPALREDRAPIDRPAARRSPSHPDARGEAQTAAGAADVHVEIGRIDVRVAPAPAARQRAAPEGFAGYWRLRNYLDRPR